MINFYTLTWLDGSIYLLRHGLILKLTKKSNLVWLHFTPTKLEHRRNTWCFPNLFCVIQTKKSQSWWNGIDFKVKEEKVSSKNLEQKGGGGERRGGEWERREQARSDECSVVVTVVTLGIFPPQTQDGGSTGSGATDQLWARHQVRIVSALCMSVDPPVSPRRSESEVQPDCVTIPASPEIVHGKQIIVPSFPIPSDTDSDSGDGESEDDNN